MKRNSSSDPDTALDEFFRVREMSPDDFATRTLTAARSQARRARTLRFTAWTSGLAASLALLLGLSLWQRAGQPPEMVSAPAVTELAAVSEKRKPGPITGSSANDLTLALEEALSRANLAFYGQALALDSLLADARALTDEENRDTLDFLILLAGN